MPGPFYPQIHFIPRKAQSRQTLWQRYRPRSALISGTCMRLPRAAYLVGVLWFCTSGCLARQIASDGCSFRQAVLDIYTAQILDNLICAAQDRPFVQVGYHALQVTDEHVV